MIKFQITGTDRAIAQITETGKGIERSMRDTVGRLTLKLQRKVRADKLTGQVLKVRTGNLRRSIDTAVINSASGTVGVVSTNVKYGRVHEYGFSGGVTVRAHLRRAKMVYGKQVNPFVANVSSHTRMMNLPERSFLRSALADMSEEIQMELLAAANRAIRGGGNA